MRVLVVGGAGFIGAHVVEALSLAGHAVTVLDQRAVAVPRALPMVTHLTGSLGDRTALATALREIDAVLHLASTTVPATAESDPVADVEQNLIGTLGLLDAMAQAGVKRLVFLSSGGTVYGLPQHLPIPETAPLLPIGSYGIVKAAIERYIAVHARRGLLPVVIRASNPYGPGQPTQGAQGFIGSTLGRLWRGEPVEIWGDGSVVRDYFHVRDLADLCVRALGATSAVTVNAGSGVGLSLRQVVTAMERVTGRAITPVTHAARPVDVPVSVLDVSLARKVFDWQARIPLDEGLAETWAWVKVQA